MGVTDGFLKNASISWEGDLPPQFIDWADKVSGNLADSITLPDFAVNGSIGTAPNTVDLVGYIIIHQTTGGVALTLPPPTNPAAGRRLTISNSGTQSVSVGGVAIGSGAATNFIWSGVGWAHIT